MESNLSVKVSDLEGEVGIFAGWGRDPDGWDEEQTDILKSCVRSGLRTFYFPPPLDPSGDSYDWSFLRPFATLTLPSGENELMLPDDFGGMEGQLLIQSPTNFDMTAIDHQNEGTVRQALAEAPDSTGAPIIFAVVAIKGTKLTEGQRYKLVFFPVADTAYTLQLQYYLIPNALDGTRPYAYGGASHAETILESCKAAYEAQQDDSDGLHQKLFMQRLATSISVDRRFKPQKFGPNLDHSDEMYGMKQRRWNAWPVTTLDGVTPD